VIDNIESFKITKKDASEGGDVRLAVRAVLVQKCNNGIVGDLKLSKINY